MWRFVLPFFALSGVAQAYPACHPSESSNSDLARATEIVKRLPELTAWTNDNSVFDTGARANVRGRCYEAVYVYSVLPTKNLDLRYVFVVYLPTQTILFEDIPTLEFLTLRQWRVRRARGT